MIGAAWTGSRWGGWLLFLVMMQCFVGSVAMAQQWPMWRANRLRSARSSVGGAITSPSVRWSFYLGGKLDGRQVRSLDLDGDGSLDVVTAPGGKIVVKDGRDRILWESRPLGILVIEGLWNLDGSGPKELVVRSATRVYALDGATGQVAWSYGYAGNVTSVTALDLDGNGTVELFVEGYLGQSCNREIRRFDFSSGFDSVSSQAVFSVNLCNSLPFVFGDMDADGALEMMVDTYGTYRVIDPATGIALASQSLFSNHTYDWVWMKDLDGDGRSEYAMLSWQGFAQRALVERFDGSQLTNLWMRAISTNNNQHDVRNTIFDADSVADLDGDGHYEIVLSTFNEFDDGKWRLLVLDALDGGELVDVEGLEYAGLWDADGDGRLEILAMDASSADINGVDYGTVRLLSYAPPALNVLWSLDQASVHDVTRFQSAGFSHMLHAPALQDLDGDGILDCYFNRDLDDDGQQDAIEVLSGAGNQPTVLARYRPVQSGITAVVAAMGDDLTGPQRRAETLVSLSNGFVVGLDSMMATTAVLRTGGYSTFKILVSDLEGDGDSEVLVVDSRGILRVLDQAGADLTRPPQERWHYDAKTQFYPLVWDLDGDGVEEVIVAAWDGTGKVVEALAPDGSVRWSHALGFGVQKNDTIMKPAMLRSGAMDLVVSVYDGNAAVRRLVGLDLQSGQELWSTSQYMGYNYLEDYAIYDIDSDGIEDVVYQNGSGSFQVYSGVDGAVLVHQTRTGYERRPQLVDCDGDLEYEIVVGTGPSSLSLLDQAGRVLWEFPSPITYGFDNRDPAPVHADASAGYDLAFGDKFGQMRVVSGADGSLVYSKWLSDGQVLDQDPGQAASLGNAVAGDLDGDGGDEILIPSADGFLYLLHAQDGTLVWSQDFRYPVAEPALADLDGDGSAEILVSSSDGYLYALQAAGLPAPGQLRDVGLDDNGSIPDPSADIDQSEYSDMAAAAWDPVGGASGYLVSLVSEQGGVVVPWTDVPAATNVRFDDLSLERGSRYYFLVSAYGSGLDSSVQVRSDGFEVRDDSPPVIEALHASPDIFSPNSDGQQDGTSVLARLSDRTALDSVVVTIEHAQQTRTFTAALTGTEHHLVQVWDGLDDAGQPVGEGPCQVTVLVTDAAGHSASAQTEVVVDTEAPSPPVILVPESGSTTPHARVELAGTAERQALVDARIDGESACTVRADDQGQWSCIAGFDLLSGPHGAEARAVDAAGNESAPSVPVDFHVDLIAPSAPLFLEPVPDAVLESNRPTFVGTAEPGASVTVLERDDALCSAMADDQGHWSCQAENALLTGLHVAWAYTQDMVGNRSAPSEDLPFVVAFQGGAGGDGGPSGDAGTSEGQDAGPDVMVTAGGSGCGCSQGRPGSGDLPLVMFMGLVFWLLLRRSRQSTRSVTIRRWLGLGGLALMMLVGSCRPNPENLGPRPQDAGGSFLDSDGDCLSDEQEGAVEQVDTDQDGTPDFLDSDSDGDGIPDQVEAGAAACSNGVGQDSDGDGIPDFRDRDSDGNGIDDAEEPQGDLDGDGQVDSSDLDDDGDGLPDTMEMQNGERVDSDGDGTTDDRDIDSDGDSISDRQEGNLDTDEDGKPDYLDSDSDNDGWSDAQEAGDASLDTAPADSDGDGVPDFRDLDSDGDGLPDSQEAQEGTSRTRRDSDGDGVSDLVEVAAGTDPNDAESHLAEGDLFFELPYRDESGPKTGEVDFQIAVQKMDVVFAMDTTSSMGGELDQLKSSVGAFVNRVRAEVADTAFGLARFEDFPLAPYGNAAAADQPFSLVQQVTLDATKMADAVASLGIRDGGDLPEASLEALYQIATGAGIQGPGATDVPSFTPDPNQGTGSGGGVGFHDGALPVVVHVTDAPFHDPGAGPGARDCFDGALDYGAGADPAVPGAATRDQTMTALQAAGIRVVGIVSREYPVETHCSPYGDLRQTAQATGAMVPVEAFAGACGPGLCCTGVDGAPRPPAGDGRCPLVFEIRNDGTGLGDRAADAVLALTRYLTMDVNLSAQGQTQSQQGDPLPQGRSSADFVTAMEADRAVPPPGMAMPTKEDRDADGIAETFAAAPAGTWLRFQVSFFNDFAQPADHVQLFVLDLFVLGEGRTLLDQRRVYVVVPPVLSTSPVE